MKNARIILSTLSIFAYSGYSANEFMPEFQKARQGLALDEPQDARSLVNPTNLLAIL